MSSFQENNIEAATGAKFALEQQQRMDAAKRKEDGTKWETKYFTPEGKGGGEDKWHYNKPLIDRLSSKQIKQNFHLEYFCNHFWISEVKHEFQKRINLLFAFYWLYSFLC